MTAKATREQLTSTARAVAVESSENAGRISSALIALDDAAGSLRAGGGGRGGSERPDPTFRAVGKVDEAAEDRRRVERILQQQLVLSKELSGLLANWSPDEDRQRKLRGVTATNDDMWCPNHALHGMDEVRKPEHRHCKFCDEFGARDDVLAIAKARKATGEGKLMPNRWLLDVRARRTINSADIAKAVSDIIDDNRARKAADRAARKAAKQASKSELVEAANPQGP